MISSDYAGQALVTFTYDDGRRNNYEAALPLHEEFSIPAVFAIIADRACSSRYSDRYMTAHEVGDASRRGVEIASHSLSHSSRLTDLDDDALDKELRASKESLSLLTPRGSGVSSLCVPFSKADGRVLDAACSLYQYVRLDGKKLNDVTSLSSVVYSHPVLSETTAEDIARWVDKAVREKKWLVLMFHGIVPDADQPAKYDTREGTLRSVLRYVDSFTPQELLPVKFDQVDRIRRNLHVEKASAVVEGPRPREFVLADAPGYKITYHRNLRPTGKLVISFGGLPSKKTTTGFGSKFILSQGWDHVFVAQAAMTQYQELSVEEFREAVGAIAAEYDVFAYGSSLGAYAALYYGGSVDARIIAAAPKNSAHPLVLQKRFAALGFRHRELVDTPHSKHSPVILFDPHRRDESKFIRKLVLPAYPDAHLVELPYAGHTVLETMKSMGSLKSFVGAYVDAHEIRDVEIREDGLSVFPAERGREAMLAGNYELALTFFRDSLRINFSAEGGSGNIKALLRLGRKEEARAAAVEFEEHIGSLRGIPDWARRELQ